MRKRKEFPTVTRWTIRRLRVQRSLGVHVRPDYVFAELLARLPAKPSMHVWQALRMLHIWLGASDDERIGMFVPEGLAELEEEILLSAYDRRLSDPLAVIVGCLGPSPVSAARLGWACLCVSDWASQNRFPHTMLGFAYCGAFATDSPRYYLVAELAAVGVELAGLAGDDPEHRRAGLEARRRELAKVVAAEGGLVSYAAG